jgi:hypothetical protein
MICYKVLNVVNGHVVSVLPVAHTPILSYYTILSYEMSFTKPMQLTVSIISNSASLSTLGALLFPTFSQQFCLKYVGRVRLVFR